MPNEADSCNDQLFLHLHLLIQSWCNMCGNISTSRLSRIVQSMNSRDDCGLGRAYAEAMT